MGHRLKTHERRIDVEYYLNGIKKRGKAKREFRERVHFCVYPRTKELMDWLTPRWSPGKPSAKAPGRAIDHFTQKYWKIWVDPGNYPPREWSTRQVMEEMCEYVKRGEKLDVFPNLNLVRWPNRSRLLDYLATYWRAYENIVYGRNWNAGLR